MPQVGPRHRFRQQEFWAESGLVCIENQDTGEFKAITRAEAAARAVALNAELRYLDYPDERKELCDCVVALCEAVKEAKRQGDPTNPEVVRQKVKELKKASMITGPEVPNDGAVLLTKKDSNSLLEAYHSAKFINIKV